MQGISCNENRISVQYTLGIFLTARAAKSIISSKCALLLFEGIPRALKGKKLRLKNILLLPLIFEDMNSFQSFKSEGRIQLEGNF